MVQIGLEGAQWVHVLGWMEGTDLGMKRRDTDNSRRDLSVTRAFFF